MANTEINLNPVEFITVGTIGPKGQRVFHLQAGHEGKLISFVIEKGQAKALSQAIVEMIEELDKLIRRIKSIDDLRKQKGRLQRNLYKR